MIFVECNYEIYNKNFLIIIKIFEKWKFKLKNFKFFIQIIIDYKNLKYFMFFKFFTRKQIRWFKYFFRFNFKIIYRLNKLNNAINNLNRTKTRFKKKNKIMWQTILKQNNLHIQICFLKINILNDDDVNFLDVFNENFNDIDVFNEIFIDKKLLKN